MKKEMKKAVKVDGGSKRNKNFIQQRLQKGLKGLSPLSLLLDVRKLKFMIVAFT